MFIVPIIFAILLIIISSIYVVPDGYAYVIERCGKYYETRHTGISIKMPFTDRIAKKVSLLMHRVDCTAQPVITNDNITMLAEMTVFFNVVDPQMYTYGAENTLHAIEMLAITTMRNVIGDINSHQALINGAASGLRIRSDMNDTAAMFGVSVAAVDIKIMHRN